MSKRFAQYATAVLAYNLGVVLWGAYVRATGSGAGCGNHWPLCNGVVVPQTPEITTLIEFTHRAMSGLDVVLVLTLVVWAFRAFPRGHASRLGAAFSGLFLVTEALIGAALVKLEHVAQKASVGRAWSLSGHLINTLALLASLACTAWWAAAPAPVRWKGRALSLAAPGVVLFLLAGISGAIAALGDTLFPAHSLATALAQDFDSAASIFLRLRFLHPLLACLTAAWLLFYALRNQTDTARPFARTVLALLALQLTAGAVNFLLLAPIWMQMLHLLLADLLWIALVLLTASSLQDALRSADIPADEMVVGPAGLQRAGSK